MRLALPSSLLLCGCLLACGGTSNTSTDLAPAHDLAGRDLKGSPDQSQPTSTAVRCGGSADAPTLCTSQKAICCSADDGQTGTCEADANACPAGVPYRCDEPSQCQSGQVCCQTESGANSAGSACLAAADCASAGDYRLCLKTSDCNSGETCCSCGLAITGHASYMKCTTALCPAILRHP